MTQTSFDPNNHLIQLKSKAGSQDYLPVQFRLVWFRRDCPEGTIETEEVFVDLDREIETEAYVWNAEKRRSEKVVKQAKGYARFRATVTDGKGGRATATGSESAVDFPDYIEKAETKAVGRALAMLGYGTQFAPEFGEQHRIVDAPVDSAETNSGSAPTTAPRVETATSASNRKPASTPPAPHNLRPAAPTKPAPQQNAAPTDEQDQAAQPAQPKITPQQAERIRSLCKALNQNEPEGLAEMAYFEAKALYEQLAATYKAQKQAALQTAHSDAPIQDKATTNMVNKAKSRVEAIEMIWGDVKRDSLHGQVEDKDLTVAQYAKVIAVIEQYEQTAKAS